MQYLTQDEAWAVINNKYVSRNGSKITFEKTLSNQTTDAIDFSQYGEISNANITLIGASYYNKHPAPANSGYEWGNKTGYAGKHIGYLQVINDSSQAYEGSYYGNLTSTLTGWEYLETEKIPWTCSLDAKGVVASVYVKWNGSESTQGVLMSVYERNSTDGSTWVLKEVTYNITKSWQRINVTVAGHIKKGYDQIFARIRAKLTVNDSYLTDAWLIEECDPNIQGMPPAMKKHNVYIQSPYFTSELKTQNPSVTINGQTFSYYETLNDGQEASSESITLPKTGIAHIHSINVKGSGLVKIKIQATVGIIGEGIFLREYMNNVYVGHYYNSSYTFSAGSQIGTLSDPFANITSASLSRKILTFTVSAESGRTSTTKVYCGDKDEPTSVSGATSWSYDSVTKVLTITAVHSSLVTIVVNWSLRHGPPPPPPSPQYCLTVTVVDRNDIRLPNVKVTVWTTTGSYVTSGYTDKAGETVFYLLNQRIRSRLNIKAVSA